MSRSKSSSKTNPADSGNREPSPCDTCDRRDVCETPCERLEKLLPRPREGGMMLSIPIEVADHSATWRQDCGQKNRELFSIFLEHREELTPKQWQCVELVYEQDLSVREAARQLGVYKRTVECHLSSAARKLVRKQLADPCTGGGAAQNGGGDDPTR